MNYNLGFLESLCEWTGVRRSPELQLPQYSHQSLCWQVPNTSTNLLPSQGNPNWGPNNIQHSQQYQQYQQHQLRQLSQWQRHLQKYPPHQEQLQHPLERQRQQPPQYLQQELQPPEIQKQQLPQQQSQSQQQQRQEDRPEPANLPQFHLQHPQHLHQPQNRFPQKQHPQQHQQQLPHHSTPKKQRLSQQDVNHSQKNEIYQKKHILYKLQLQKFLSQQLQEQLQYLHQQSPQHLPQHSPQNLSQHLPQHVSQNLPQKSANQHREKIKAMNFSPKSEAISFHNEISKSSIIDKSDFSARLDDSEEEENIELAETHEAQNSINNYKLKRTREIMKSLMPFPFFSRTTTTKSLHKRYQGIKNSSKAKFCLEWSQNSITPVLPSKRVLKKSCNHMLSPHGHRSWQWRAPVLFSHSDAHHSDQILCRGIKIPYSHEPGYGTSFVYLSLPRTLEKQLKKPPKEYPNLETRDPDLHGLGREWWKIATNVDGLFGIVNKVGNFEPKCLKPLFEKTQKGIRADLVLKIHCEASAETWSALRRKDVQTVRVEIVQGNIKKIGQDIDRPSESRAISQAAGFKMNELLAFQLKMMGI